MAVNKKLIVVLTALIAIFALAVSPAKADTYDPTPSRKHIVIDEAKLFSTSDVDKINKEMKKSDYKTLVVTTNKETDDIHAQSEEYYDQAFGSKKLSGICILINMKERKVYLTAYGHAKDKLDDAANRDVTDNIYQYLSDKQYAKGVIIALQQSNDIIADHFVARPLRMVEALLLGTLLGFLGMFGIAYISRTTFNRNTGKIPDDIDPNYSNALVGGNVESVITNLHTYEHTERKSHGGDGFSGGDSSDDGGFSGGGDYSSSGGGHSF